MLTHSFLEEEAWLDLTSNAKIAYIYFKKQKKNAALDEEIKFRYRAHDQPLPFASFRRAKRDLVEHGFLEVIELGGLEKRVTKYKFSERWKNWTKGTKYKYVDT